MKHPAVPRIHSGTTRNLTRLARLLRAGALVAVPTETVYGLAANALDARACREIFRAKRRPLGDPLIVHIHTLAQLEEVCVPNAAALQLATAFWPGPLTLVLPKRESVPGIVSAGLASVAVRMPAHPLFRRLLKATGLPLAAPSANPFGYVSPTTAQHVRDGLAGRIGHILDGGASRIGLESTIVDLRRPARPRVLRPGAITAEAISRVLGCPVSSPRRKPASHPAPAQQIAPGLLARHYSPRTPVKLHRRLKGAPPVGEAYVYFRQPAPPADAKPPRAKSGALFWLDRDGDHARAARRLFALLRELDAKGFHRLHVELAPEGDLAPAINDRLRRAAAR